MSLLYSTVVVDPRQLEPEQIRPLRRAEFDRMVEAGILDRDERIELLRGALVAMSPQGARHADCAARLTEILIRALPEAVQVRCQLPFAASEISEPEPDVAVYPRASYSSGHPENALLIVEIADASLRKDRGVKAEIYAEAGVPEYWIVDLVHGVVEVRTVPRDGHYTRTMTFSGEDEVTPVAFPDLVLAVGGFLPEP
jgi:Uma2 family endonuclease